MASFSVSSYTATSVTIKVTGISSGDSVRFFIRIASDTSDTTVDSTYTATSTTMTKTFSGLTASTRYAYNVSVNGTFGTAKYFTTAAASSGRPDDWSWYSTISSGKAIKLSALEWNDFTTRINDFRVYKGLYRYGFTTVTSGDKIYAYMINQAISAISDMDGHGTLPSTTVSMETPISASIFTKLKNALNAIS